MDVGSLFSGIGGIERGFEMEGFKTKWFVESDEFCQRVLRKNFPNIPIYGDIRQIKFQELKPVSILTGGFPCQDVSYAGKRKGLAGTRSGLWSEYRRAISEIRPKYVVVENVPGLFTNGFGKVIGDLSEIGYDAEWTTLRASDVGALHRRERIFIIAYPCGRDEQTIEPISARQPHIQRRIITHDWGQRIQRFREEALSGESGFSWCKDVRRIEDLKGRPNIPEPLFRGGRDGIPNWVDRIKSCGNAVVPQCAQVIARQIKERYQ